jgi:uncharacterized protein YecE (DUF72 family)
MKDPAGQGFLFGMPEPAPSGSVGPAAVAERTAAIARRLPANVFLGTSSWTFPGWEGIVYDRKGSMAQLADRGLEAYASHPLFRTVGLDRAFYRPPPRAEFEKLARQTPHGFRFLVKAYQGLTRPDADDRGRTHGDAAKHKSTNALFLDASFALHEVIQPALEGLGTRCGPIVFQFPPLDLKSLGGAGAFIKKLGGFIERLSSHPSSTGACLCVEVRNRELLSEEHAGSYAAALGASGHVVAVHPTMPSPLAQASVFERAGRDVCAASTPLVVRWMLRANHQYDEAKELYSPFNRLVEEDVPSRLEIASLVAKALKSGRDAFVIINNKAEGSAPMSVEELAGVLAGID